MEIINASWINSSGELKHGCIKIHNDSIAEITENFYSKPSIALNASDLLILPGAIDPHVHFREPGAIRKEGIINGSKAALVGGVTTVLDMPNNAPPISSIKRWEKKKKLFEKKCLINWGLHFHTSYRQKQVPKDYASGKVYMAAASKLKPITEVNTLAAIMARFVRVAIHAEDQTLFQSGLHWKQHHKMRSREAIVGALKKIEEAMTLLPKTKRPRIILCHISTLEEVEWLRQRKEDGWDIWGETCPHYLFFTQQNLIKHGAMYLVNPPLRTSRDKEALRKALRDGIIDFLGSDHAPHLPQEKQSNKPPSGIAGIEWFWPLVIKLVEDNVFNWATAMKVVCLNAAKCYEIPYRGKIERGYFADLVFFRKTNSVHKTRIITKAAKNPYSKILSEYYVESVLINGKWVMPKFGVFKTNLGKNVYGN